MFTIAPFGCWQMLVATRLLEFRIDTTQIIAFTVLTHGCRSETEEAGCADSRGARLLLDIIGHRRPVLRIHAHQGSELVASTGHARA